MTDKQKQHLLAYLGYYVGEIDGIFGTLSRTAAKAFQQDFGGIAVDGIVGPETEKALKHAVAYGMPAKEPVSVTGGFWDGVKHFTRSEFACKCKKYCDGFPVEPDEKLVRLAEQVREYFSAPITVSSGIRCETHNANVGGVANSRHLSGKAMDFCVNGIPSAIVLPYVQSLSGVRYAYAIDGNYVHMDVE